MYLKLGSGEENSDHKMDLKSQYFTVINNTLFQIC